MSSRCQDDVITSCDFPTVMSSIVIKYIRKEIRKGFSPIILIVGRQRTGKTATAMRLAYDIDNTWHPSLMTSKIEEFLHLYNDHSKKILILDEASISLDPYEHMTITQRVYRHVIDTQAYKQNTIFIVLPFARGIGRTARDYVNMIINVKARGFYVAKAVFSQHDDLSFKPPYTWILEECHGVPLPPDHIWKPYLEGGQKKYKEAIMDVQMNILNKKVSGFSANVIEDAI